MKSLQELRVQLGTSLYADVTFLFSKKNLNVNTNTLSKHAKLADSDITSTLKACWPVKNLKKRF